MAGTGGVGVGVGVAAGGLDVGGRPPGGLEIVTGQPSAAGLGTSGSGRRARAFASPSTSSPRGVVSQASPIASPSASAWSALASVRAVVLGVAHAVAVARPGSRRACRPLIGAVVVGSRRRRGRGRTTSRRRRPGPPMPSAARGPDRAGGVQAPGVSGMNSIGSPLLISRVLELVTRARVLGSASSAAAPATIGVAIDVPLQAQIAAGRRDRREDLDAGREEVDRPSARRCPSTRACRWRLVMPTQTRLSGSVRPGAACCTGRRGAASLSLPSLPAATTYSVFG